MFVIASTVSDVRCLSFCGRVRSATTVWTCITRTAGCPTLSGRACAACVGRSAGNAITWTQSNKSSSHTPTTWPRSRVQTAALFIVRMRVVRISDDWGLCSYQWRSDRGAGGAGRTGRHLLGAAKGQKTPKIYFKKFTWKFRLLSFICVWRYGQRVPIINYYVGSLAASVDITWDLCFKQAVQFQKPKTKWRPIWPPPWAAKGPATPLALISSGGKSRLYHGWAVF